MSLLFLLSKAEKSNSPSIEAVREEEEGPDTDDDDEPGGRGERPTPEEEALDRLLNRH